LFNDMEAAWPDGVPAAIAVGDDGLIARSAFPIWILLGNRREANWYTLAVRDYDADLAVAGESGALFVVRGGSWFECTIADEDIVVLSDRSYESSVGVTRTGRVFAATGPATAIVDPCFTGQVVGTNPRAAGLFCGLAFNVFLMDETAVYGTTGCAIE
jgi:hypothetical protein